MTNFFAKNLQMLLDKSGMSVYDLAPRIGTSASTVYRWLDPNLSYLPRSRTRVTISEVFGVDPVELVYTNMSGAAEGAEGNKAERANIHSVLGERIPLLASTANLEIPHIFDDDISLTKAELTPSAEKWLPPCPDEAVRSTDLIAIRMNGEAMAPEIRDGDLLYVDFDFAFKPIPNEYKSGDIVLANHFPTPNKEEVLVRKLSYGDSPDEVWLKATNPDWPSEKRLVKGSLIFGKVVAIFRKL